MLRPNPYEPSKVQAYTPMRKRVKSVDFPDLKRSARIRKTNLRQVSRAFCKHERRQKRDRLGGGDVVSTTFILFRALATTAVLLLSGSIKWPPLVKLVHVAQYNAWECVCVLRVSWNGMEPPVAGAGAERGAALHSLDHRLRINLLSLRHCYVIGPETNITTCMHSDRSVCLRWRPLFPEEIDAAASCV